MANIASFRPTEAWGALSPLDELIRGFIVKPLARENAAWAGATPFRLDVSETEKDYRVVAEMPGVRKEDISVSIDGNQVTVSAEVKRENEAKEGERVLRSERYYGKIQRVFALEHPIDEANAQARYTDGILELTLPKSEAAMPKRISVH